MNLVFIYYNQPRMLEDHLALWQTYSGHRIVLVDDGSQKYPAREIVAGVPGIELYRVLEDKPWNLTGARNLGCSQCQGWIYVSDIDTLLPVADADRLFSAPEPGRFYFPRRVNDAGGRIRRPSVVNLLFERSAFDAAGGYDEDYAGHYGREEWDFHGRLSRVAVPVFRDDVTVRCVPPWKVRDASATGLDRDWQRNIALYTAKRAAGFPRPGPGLRFAWERVF